MIAKMPHVTAYLGDEVVLQDFVSSVPSIGMKLKLHDQRLCVVRDVTWAITPSSGHIQHIRVDLELVQSDEAADMPPYMQRVVLERDDLMRRCKALDALFIDPRIRQLDQQEQFRLRSQFQYMVGYLHILNERIEAFVATEEEKAS